MDFKGKAKRLTDQEIPQLGAMIGVGEDEVHAFLDVEAAGSGFDSHGRPKMLFEGHIFYRHLSASKRSKAVAAGLAWPTWKQRKPYLKDSYPRLIAAMEIDKNAALKACSWGIAQVLGENHTVAGYSTVVAMVEAAKDSEYNQLLMAINFIKGNGLDDELRNHEWAAFARGYNGPGYKENRYDEQLEQAYRKWAKIPDTPYPPTPTGTVVKLTLFAAIVAAFVEWRDAIWNTITGWF